MAEATNPNSDPDPDIKSPETIIDWAGTVTENIFNGVTSFFVSWTPSSMVSNLVLGAVEKVTNNPMIQAKLKKFEEMGEKFMPKMPPIPAIPGAAAPIPGAAAAIPGAAAAAIPAIHKGGSSVKLPKNTFKRRIQSTLKNYHKTNNLSLLKREIKQFTKRIKVN